LNWHHTIFQLKNKWGLVKKSMHDKNGALMDLEMAHKLAS
jgi:hypothetical protein